MDEAVRILDQQLINLKELARFIVVNIHSVVLGDQSVLTNRSFVESLNLNDLRFDPEAMRLHYSAHEHETEEYLWSFDPQVLQRFSPRPDKPVYEDHFAEDLAMEAPLGGVT